MNISTTDPRHERMVAKAGGAKTSAIAALPAFAVPRYRHLGQTTDLRCVPHEQPRCGRKRTSPWAWEPSRRCRDLDTQRYKRVHHPKIAAPSHAEEVLGKVPDCPTIKVRLRRRPSDFGYDPMISPTLCPISFTALESKFSLRLMAFAVGIGRMRTSSELSRRVLSATGKWQPRRGGIVFVARC